MSSGSCLTSKLYDKIIRMKNKITRGPLRIRRPNNCVEIVFFYSDRDFIYFSQSLILPSLRRLWGKPGSNPKLMRCSLVSPLSHHIPKLSLVARPHTNFSLAVIILCNPATAVDGQGPLCRRVSRFSTYFLHLQKDYSIDTLGVTPPKSMEKSNKILFGQLPSSAEVMVF
jgi:hypothetical protein